MLVMTSRCFDGLSWAVTALSLSKPNPACARHRVSETGPASPWRGAGSVSLQLPPAGHKAVSLLNFPQEGQRVCGRAQSRKV